MGSHHVLFQSLANASPRQSQVVNTTYTVCTKRLSKINQSLITFHFSPFTNPLPFSLLTAALAAQGQSMQNPGVLWFMIKQWQIGDQIHDHNRGELRHHPEGSGAGDLRQTPGDYAFFGLHRSVWFGGHRRVPARTDVASVA
jgi:hypothetical protein